MVASNSATSVRKFALDGHSYVISDDKARVVDLAIALQRPLLVEGEAGCGKTLLATAIADFYGWPLRKISVKSTTRARDLLYRFDALRRLQESQINDEAIRKRALFVHNYITLDTLGQAIFAGKRSVILIDEIDKADIDFPNDLLDVLEDFKFDIEDLPESEIAVATAREGGYGRTVSPTGQERPVVVITSNGEKRLPEPFLRRCLFLELEFPTSHDALSRIVEINLQGKLGKLNSALIERGVKSFVAIRKLAAARGVQKKPATSELIDWLHALHLREGDPVVDGLRPPYWELLFKSREDLATYTTASAAEAPPTA